MVTSCASEASMKAIFYAFLAAVFYAINIPASKVMLRDVGPTTMAALLYLGAGIGIAVLSLLNTHGRKASASLTRRDMPFVVCVSLVPAAEGKPVVDVSRGAGRDGRRGGACRGRYARAAPHPSAPAHLHTFPRRLCPYAYDHPYPLARPSHDGRQSCAPSYAHRA